ncbi:TPA: VirD4-like conjugal transfer protein, CD1115 family [Streptococcus suis]
MYQNRQKKFWPYLLLSLFLAYIFSSVVVFYSNVPIEVQPLEIISLKRIEWMIDNYSAFPFIPSQITPTSLCAGIVGFFIGLILFLRIGDNGIYRHGEEQGSARFATVKEMATFRDKESEMNMIFSKNSWMGLINKRLPYSRQLNKNVIVIGLPGDGKTFTYVKPNIMQTNSSFIITDPKGLLVYEVGDMLEKAGYTIKVFDLVHLSNSNTFNVFSYIRSELDIDRIAEAIVDGTKKSDQQGEDFWVQAELMLMRSLLAYLYFDGELNGYTPNLSNVADLLRNLQREEGKEDIPSPVERMFEDLEKRLPNNYANKQWQLFNSNFKSETRTSVLAVLSARYSVFDHEQVKQMVATDTMEIEKWNTEKTAVFIAIPETNKAFNFMASLMFAMMFEILTHKADDILQGKIETDKPLLHVQMIIDEFANIGRIPNFNEVLASVRSREMSCKIIVQAINQLKSMYKNDWQTLVNNCATLLFLGTNDEETMKYLSTRAGKQTINLKNRSITRGRNGSMSESHQTHQRDLMTPDEVARIGVDEALVFIAKQNVFKDKKASVFDHPRAKELADGPKDANWYHYKRYMSDIAEWLESIDQRRQFNHTDSHKSVVLFDREESSTITVDENNFGWEDSYLT